MKKRAQSEISVNKIIQWNEGLVVFITKQAREAGMKRGDQVMVKGESDKEGKIVVIRKVS